MISSGPTSDVELVHSAAAVPRDESALRTLLRIPLISNWAAGLLLFACFWMPHVTGCNNVVVRPVDAAMDTIQRDVNPVGALFYAWPHLFGLLVALSVFYVVLARPESPDRILSFAAIGCWSFLWLVCGYAWSLIDSPDELLRAIAVSLPICLLPSWWIAAAARNGHWMSAWARAVTSAAALGIFCVYVAYIFQQDTHYGLFLTYSSLLLLIVSPWALLTRWRPLLIASSEPIEPLRYKIWQLLVATSLPPLIYAYYQVLPVLFGNR